MSCGRLADRHRLCCRKAEGAHHEAEPCVLRTMFTTRSNHKPPTTSVCTTSAFTTVDLRWNRESRMGRRSWPDVTERNWRRMTSPRRTHELGSILAAPRRAQHYT